MGSHGRSQEGSAIAQDRDEPGQMLQLQPIVERVPKAMGPMEEGQGDEDEEVESYQRMRDEPLEELVAGCLEPSQGKGQTGQKEMDGEEECGNRPLGGEQQPQERRDPPHYLPPQQHKGHGPREHEPGRVVRAEDDPVGHSLAPQPHDHGLGGQIEPCDGMEEDKEEGNRIEGEEERRPEPGEELSIGFGPLGQGVELPEIDHGEEGHEDTGELAQDKPSVGALLKPPPDASTMCKLGEASAARELTIEGEAKALEAGGRTSSSCT